MQAELSNEHVSVGAVQGSITCTICGYGSISNDSFNRHTWLFCTSTKVHQMLNTG